MKNSTIAIIIFAAGGLVCLAMAMLMSGSDQTARGSPHGTTLGTNSYSLSAVGFSGLFEIVREAGPGAERLHVDDPRILHGGSLLVYTSDPDDIDLGIMGGGGGQRAAALIILDKWEYSRHPIRYSWVGDLNLIPMTAAEDNAAAVLSVIPGAAAGAGGRDLLTRSPWPSDAEFSSSFTAVAPAPLLGPGEETGTRFPFGRKPEGGATGDAPPGAGDFQPLMQLLTAGTLETVAAARGGILLGRIETEGGAVYVLSDPDMANNMGLARPSNPAFMAALVGHIMEREKLDGRVIFAEPLFRNPASLDLKNPLLKSLSTFPLSLIVLFAVAAGAAFALALGTRFGGPLPPEILMVFGKGKLIDNSGSLLARGNLAPDIAEDYARMMISRACRALHAPKNLPDHELRAFLVRAAQARGARSHLNLLLARLEMAKAGKSQREIVTAAGNIFAWYKEL